MAKISRSIEDDLLSASRAHARARGMSLGSLIRSLLAREIGREDFLWREALLESMDQSMCDSGGRSWKRADLYDV